MFIDKNRKSPIAWLGGKSKLAAAIVARLPKHTTYCEPFAGAAWVLFTKPPSKVEIINDINRDLVTMYRCIKHHKAALFDELMPETLAAIISGELQVQDVLQDMHRIQRRA